MDMAFCHSQSRTRMGSLTHITANISNFWPAPLWTHNERASQSSGFAFQSASSSKHRPQVAVFWMLSMENLFESIVTNQSHFVQSICQEYLLCGHCFHVLIKQDIPWCCPRCSTLLFSFFFGGLLTHIPIKDSQSVNVKPKMFQSTGMRNMAQWRRTGEIFRGPKKCVIKKCIVIF